MADLTIPNLDTFMTEGLSRRGFIRTAGAGAAGLLAVTALGWSRPQRAYAFSKIAGQAGGDAVILSAAIEIEDQATFTYKAAAGLNVLSPAALEIATRNLGDHEEHRAFLADAVSTLGDAPPAAKDTYPINGDTKTEVGLVTVAFQLEEVAVQAYFAAVAKLSQPSLRQGLASILGVEAQHVAVLRSALKLDPVPNAFIDQGI